MTRIGLVGYGAGGRLFHAPYIAAAGLELAGVVTRSQERRAQLAEDFPGVPAYDSLTDLLAQGDVDVVDITTPPLTHVDLVLEAIAAGVPVICDKPFAPDAEQAERLRVAAREAGVPLGVFHNRRWDADLRTVKAVLDGGRLGRVWQLESRFDLDEPGSLEPGEGQGLLRDLGSHLVDQAVFLLGPVQAVDARLDHVDVDGQATDAAFALTLHHASGAHSHLHATKLNHRDSRTWLVYGENGSFETSSCDVQTRDIRAGRRPADDPQGWGHEPSELWGTLRTADGETVVQSEQGNYSDFYRQVATALGEGTDLPVTADEGVAVMRILDAARLSDAERRTVTL